MTMPDAMPSPTPTPAPSQPLMGAALRGDCPQSGARTLFDGMVSFAPSCRACGLNFGQFNVGDGPAAFLTLIVGAVMVACALVLELKVHPPPWLHMLLWTPLTVAAVIGSLRVAKGMLLILEYRNKAREGRIMKDDGQS